MLRSCKYCGRVHDEHFRCPARPDFRKDSGEIERFRSGKAWKKKREEIQQRDWYICRVCFAKHGLTRDGINRKDLSVHHITPLREDFDKRLDNDNLITLCKRCHERAERGEIGRNALREIIGRGEDPPPVKEI